jgi:hypothetical protein
VYHEHGSPKLEVESKADSPEEEEEVDEMFSNGLDIVGEVDVKAGVTVVAVGVLSPSESCV